MDKQRIAAIKKSIGLGIKTEQEAYEVISLLVKEDWKWWIENTDSRVRWTEKPCVICGVMYLCGDGPTTGICRGCYWTNRDEISKLSTQRNRARDLGLPYDLTLREWYATIHDFNSKCAYCLEKGFSDLEHFVPIVLGGGTVKWNCVPSCRECNRKKQNRHPDSVIGMFPEETIGRIRAYLQGFR